MKRGLPAAGLGLCALILSAVPGQTASFDCAKATGADEKAVCASMALSDLDVRMATLYEVTGHLVGMGRRGLLQDDQRAFLKARAACGGDATCLGALYRKRIATIQEMLDQVYALGPF